MRSFIPLFSKFLAIQDLWSLGCCNHTSHAVLELSVCWIELNLSRYIDTSRFPTRCKLLAFPDVGPQLTDVVPYSVPRPMSVPMAGHAVRSLSFRNVRMDDDTFFQIIANCPQLVSLDIEARVEPVPVVTISRHTLASMPTRIPALMRLRLAYQGIAEIPGELYQLHNLTKLIVGGCFWCLSSCELLCARLQRHGVVLPVDVACLICVGARYDYADCDSVLSPPREVCPISLPANISFFKDLVADGPSNLAFIHVRASCCSSRAVTSSREEWVLFLAFLAVCAHRQGSQRSCACA